MDFLTHLPRTSRKHDAMWVIVDRLTKSTQFLVLRMTFTLEEFCRIYIREIVRLHGVPVFIVSDRDPRFTAHIVDTDETFEEGPVSIMDSRDKVLRRKTVRLVMVLWQHRGLEKTTWEHEDTMQATYPFLV